MAGTVPGGSSGLICQGHHVNRRNNSFGILESECSAYCDPANEAKNNLYIDSYQKGDPWRDAVTDAVKGKPAGQLQTARESVKTGIRY
jgi:hypothetical protein